MSRRRRRATSPCRPRPPRRPARRRCAVRPRTAAAPRPRRVRQHGFVTTSRDSSSFTAAVIAMITSFLRPRHRGGRDVGHHRGDRRGQGRRVMAGLDRARGDRGEMHLLPRAEDRRGRRVQPLGHGHGVDIGQHRVHPQRGGVLAEYGEVLLGREPGRLPGSGARFSTTIRRAAVSISASRELGDQQVRQHAGEPRPRPEHHHVGGADGGHRIGAGPRLVGDEPHPLHAAGCRRDRHLAADAVRARRLGASPVTSAPMSRGSVHIGSTRPRTPSSPRRRRAPRPVAQRVDQPGDEQVADRVARAARRCRRSGAARGCATGGPARRRRQRGHRHPQVARREQAQLAAQPTGRAAVVGHGDDGGDVVGEQAQRRSVACSPWPPPSATALSVVGGVVGAAHSRPRSRCATLTVMPGCPTAAARSPR